MGDTQRNSERKGESHCFCVFEDVSLGRCVKEVGVVKEDSSVFVCDIAGKRPSSRGGFKMSLVGICMYATPHLPPG